MEAVVNMLIKLFWVLDILDMPFMEIFDTTYPLNTLFWILVFVFVLSTEGTVKNIINNNITKKVEKGEREDENYKNHYQNI